MHDHDSATASMPATPDPQPVRLLAISGSLRAVSSNTALLRAAAALAPAHVHITLYEGLSQLPHFNPDLDTGTAPPAVEALRRQLRVVDGVLVCSPEYAHGVPGVLKNALDWIVSSGELMDKPVMLINASPRSTFAQAALIETLTVMMARTQLVAMPIKISNMDEAALRAHPEIAPVLRDAVMALAHATTTRAD